MTREGNSMTGSDFDWMVSNHAVWGWKAPVKESVSGVSLPFRFHLSPFPQRRLILRAMIIPTILFPVVDEDKNY